MYPPDGDAPLRISRVTRRRFPEPARIAADPAHQAHLDAYLADLVRPYGLALRPAPGGHSYGEMAEALIGETVRADEDVDLLVLAFAVPDIRPGRATAAYLSHVCPGRPLAFAVCDQGAAAAFTGLRLIREYTRTGECRRALLIVVEQATLHYDPIAPVALPATHTGVALLCDGSGPIAVDAVSVHSGTPTPTLPDGAALVLGNGLSPPAGRPARVAPAGHPYTGPWWELAGVLTAGPTGPLVVADYDPVLRYACVCRLSPVESAGFEGGADARLELGAS